MNLPDSFYIALCMTVLLVGAVYWVWTQIQYVQRKVNILENIVYELKTICAKPLPPDVLIGAVSSSASPSYPPAPSSVLGDDEDLLHETLHKEIQESMPTNFHTDFAPQKDEEIKPFDDDVEEVHTSTIQEESFQPSFEMEDKPMNGFDALQPGGVGSGISSESASVYSIDTMTLKELRRLAEQKGIQNANDMRKKELITAIRALPKDIFE